MNGAEKAGDSCGIREQSVGQLKSQRILKIPSRKGQTNKRKQACIAQSARPKRRSLRLCLKRQVLSLGGDEGGGSFLPSSAGVKAGRHIFSPSHCCPHQQRPESSMIQVPVPQHRSSSVIANFQKKFHYPLEISSGGDGGPQFFYLSMASLDVSAPCV
jgi:hypothetical protein